MIQLHNGTLQERIKPYMEAALPIIAAWIRWVSTKAMLMTRPFIRLSGRKIKPNLYIRLHNHMMHSATVSTALRYIAMHIYVCARTTGKCFPIKIDTPAL